MAGEGALRLKLVYVGPAGSGKTASLHQVARRIPPSAGGPVVRLGALRGEAALGEVLPVFFDTGSPGAAPHPPGLALRLHALPGAPSGILLRLSLEGAAGVVFVADARRTRAEENNRAWRDMTAVLDADAGRGGVPIVVQLNKSDLRGGEGEPGTGGAPAALEVPGAAGVVASCAARGDGCVEAVIALLGAVLDRRGLGLDPLLAAELLRRIAARLAAPAGSRRGAA